MRTVISKNAAELGQQAASLAAESIKRAVKENGRAYILVSTGQSQFGFLNALTAQDVDWGKVFMFHLDEYIGIGEDHPASFVRYLKERLKIPFMGARYIDGLAEPEAERAKLCGELSKVTIDVAFIGIGENGHIAFNDPPADLETDEPYLIVDLSETCKRQQVGEGWFAALDGVPKQAISISARQIMKARKIISVVPHRVKAKAVADTLNAVHPDPCIPATLLKEHPDWTLFLDMDSASAIRRYESARPRSPYAAERETADNGFSKGWGEFPPSEDYWVDMHSHFTGVTPRDDYRGILTKWFENLTPYRLGQAVIITRDIGMAEGLGALSREDKRVAWQYWPDINRPSMAEMEHAIKNNASGLKLHNMEIMAGDAPADIYDTAKWRGVLSPAEEAGLPVLWHVTQRMNRSPYHGGGANAYFEKGWKKGMRLTNEDFLRQMLNKLTEYPKLKIVGAHQLYLGRERLSQLFDTYENLYIDTSVGCYLRWADDFAEEDRAAYNAFVTRYADRLLFGTDADLRPAGPDEYDVQGFLCHARFISKLRLDCDTLQKVAWGNAARVFNLPLLNPPP